MTKYDEIEKKLVKFVSDEVKKAGMSKLVLGLSGGIDSALAAYIAVKAVGKENLHCIMMPYKTSSPASMAHAELVVKDLGVSHEVIDITPMADAYFAMNDDMTPLRKGNVMARTRMIVLFDHSAKLKAMVLGTSNKTERMLGYGTLYGDMACGLNPLGNLYKTQVWELSRHMGVPQELIDKKPSADLWEGQTDEGDLGFSYLDADKILTMLYDEGKTTEQVVAAGYPEIIVKSVIDKVNKAEFKRHMPPIGEII